MRTVLYSINPSSCVCVYILELSSWLDDVGPSSYRSKIKREQLEGESSSCHLVDDKAFVHNLHLWFSSTWENSPRCLGDKNGQRRRWPVAVRSTTTDHDDDDDRIKREKKSWSAAALSFPSFSSQQSRANERHDAKQNQIQLHGLLNGARSLVFLLPSPDAAPAVAKFEDCLGAK